MSQTTRPICNIKHLPRQIVEEKLDIAVVCYGGCGSNQLVDLLEENGYHLKTVMWDKIICHPLEEIETSIPIIYIYRDPRDAFLSMKRRNLLVVNQQKLQNNLNAKLNYETMLQTMIQQFDNWTKVPRPNKLIISYEDLFMPQIKETLCRFLQNPHLKGFPVFAKPVALKKPTQYIKKLFFKYQDQIDLINFYHLL